MSWRYGITREKAGGEDVFAIREVYTGDDGALSWTAEPVRIVGDTWMEVADSVSLMASCIGQPILDLTLDPPAFVSRRELPRSSRGTGGTIPTMNTRRPWLVNAVGVEEGGSWLVWLPGLGGQTYAPTEDGLEQAAREWAALELDVPIEDVEVHLVMVPRG